MTESPFEKIAERLLMSYQQDEVPFFTDMNRGFRDPIDAFPEVGLLKKLFFPAYWNGHKDKIARMLEKLAEEFYRGIYPTLLDEEKTVEIIIRTINRLPEIREKLKKDVIAAEKRDPAATDYCVVIRAYPGFMATLIHRVAHILYLEGAGRYARELSEYIRSQSGIDIHPGATIGEYFFIDHGHVVIGETAEIGDWALIYHGVTLGIFKLNGSGVSNTTKRHPTLGDDVTIGAGARILGPVAIGSNVGIGTDTKITQNIESNVTVFTEKNRLVKKPRKPKAQKTA